MYNCVYTVAIEYIHYTRLAGRWDVKRFRRPFEGRLDGDTKGSRVEIIISNASNRPIYEQIANQVKAAILSGELTEGEQLPSIRALANSLRVSVITTKRAYTDLEAAGFIETVQGKGCFVAGGNAELIRRRFVGERGKDIATHRFQNERDRERALLLQRSKNQA